MRYGLIALAIFVTTARPTAQGSSAEARGLRFEVASVRPVGKSDGLPPGFALNPRIVDGRVTWTTTLDRLVKFAYGLPGWQVAGIRGEPAYYTIAATVRGAVTRDEVCEMFRTLLSERFGAVTHTRVETRDIYNLVVGKSGSRLDVAAPGKLPPLPEYMSGKSAEAFEGQIVVSQQESGIVAITGRGVSIAGLATALSDELGVHVEDRTGLRGSYYFGFKFRKPDNTSAAPDAPSVFDALREASGLTLEKSTGPVAFLVIDRMDPSPLPN